MDEPLIDPARLRDSVEHTAARLAELPSRGVIRPRVSTRLIRDVTAEASFEQFGRQFSFRNDEPPGRGGAGVEPTSIRYFLSGLAFCLQVWLAKGAALVGCVLEDLELDIEAQLDMRREYLLPPTGTSEYVVAELRITSPSTEHLVLAVADEAHRRCPLVHAVALPIHWRVTHNGLLIRDDAPADPTGDDQRPTA